MNRELNLSTELFCFTWPFEEQMDVKYQEKFRCQHNKEKIHQVSTHILLPAPKVLETLNTLFSSAR